MDTSQFDKALISAVFQQAALVGWREASLVSAARDASLDLARVRIRFPGKTAVLLRFGVVMDQAVLAGAPSEGTSREKLFDLLMLRFDQMQAQRAGVLAVMAALPSDPAAALMLYGATLRSMKWLLDTAGLPTSGPVGALRVHGLAAVWAYALRAWERTKGRTCRPRWRPWTAGWTGRCRRKACCRAGAWRQRTPHRSSPARRSLLRRTGRPCYRARNDKRQENTMSDTQIGQAKTAMHEAAATAQEMGRTMMEKGMAGMAEFSKLFADMKMPAMGGGMEAFMAAQRKNMEVLSAANRVALEGAQAVAKRHMEIMQQPWPR